jgi:hypothetical protein
MSRARATDEQQRHAVRGRCHAALREVARLNDADGMSQAASSRRRSSTVLAGLLGVALALASRGALASPPAEPPTVEGPAEASEPASTETEPRMASERTPRISGTYFGMTLWPALAWAYSPNLEVDQSDVIAGGGGALRLGQAVFPWMTIGLDASGGFYWNRHTFFTKGGLLVELGFYPVPRYPLSLRGGFGFGAGLILDDRTEEKGGVGGPRFMGSVRYEFFPNAERKRPRKPGGWVVGPEIGWRGFTPAAKGRPMSNTILLGVWFGYYWGR